MEKHVYIVISQTGTLLSRLLKLISKAEYNHASISLSPDLNVMYSFGRKYPYNPFWGSFVEESPCWGTFKRFSQTKVMVLDLTVTEEQYRTIQTRINAISLNRSHYHYNYLGLYLAPFRISYRHKRCYYCSEFVNHLLARSEVRGAKNPRAIVHPMHFLSLPEAKQVYSGRLMDYSRFFAAHLAKKQAVC